MTRPCASLIDTADIARDPSSPVRVRYRHTWPGRNREPVAGTRTGFVTASTLTEDPLSPQSLERHPLGKAHARPA